MHFIFLVEEPSAEAALQNILPKIFRGSATFEIHAHQGKMDLLQKLPSRLKSYSKWLPGDRRIVVLIDEDRQDCLVLKEKLEAAACSASLITRTAAGQGSRFQVLNRIAVEELEAWFFGDIDALCKAYPGIPSTLGKRSGYRDPDAIKGGTWEALERELKRAGYFQGGLGKIEAAKSISAQMDPERNRSKSFMVFMNGLAEMIRWGV
jgi:hypothetical protein